MEKRSGLNIEGKIAIARKAVKLIRPGDTIFLDSSTTSFYLAKALKEFKNITVITNNLLIVNELQTPWLMKEGTSALIMKFENGAVGYHGATWGARGTRLGYDFQVQTEKGMLESNDVEYQIKSAMIRNSRQKICIADESKLNTVAFIKLAEFSDIDYFITDKPLDDKYKKVLKKNKVEY